MNARLDFALSQVPPEWKSDEYGFYLPSVNRPPIPEGQPNCANCGEFGHTTDECKKPNRDKINFLFGSSLSNTGAAAQEEREEVISKLKRMYYS
ncbi:hypothetical protein TRFO_19759 [Tritrichomonas foetus]|uniref:CCHC-type domain-containing protein n=1 Tax=Tritrichomonas foetus TaxID=1144522 RepID=A0A1J4KIV0_9EUKA|nr:hypothetical protein TRFO_19759 [Tritrichomonas foetus]|eukprot:OHT10864.1 hypothetical protein TRFO_19759 [Tritrichomonas foetus]